MSDEAENKVDSADERKRPKTVTGTVVSAKMQKTRTVTVMRLEPHPRYGKYVRRRTNYKVHDPQEVSGEGRCRPHRRESPAFEDQALASR